MKFFFLYVYLLVLYVNIFLKKQGITYALKPKIVGLPILDVSNHLKQVEKYINGSTCLSKGQPICEG